MPIAGTATTPTYTAFVAATGLPVSNDQANHTLKLVTDGVQSSISPTITALANGEYAVSVTGSQNVGALMEISGSSSTAGVVIAPSKWENSNAAGVGGIAVNQNTPTTNAMQVTTGGGIGIPGVIIRAYLAFDYTASPQVLTIRGQAITDVSGNWQSPMYLPAGSYYFGFSSSGYASNAIGPVTVS